MNLTAQQQELVNTDFGEEIEKMAAERVGACQEAYAYGFNKLAKDIADAKDEADKKEEKKEDKEEEKMDEESEKAAAELGAFIERGTFDSLRKLGSERHGDEMHYIAPFVEEKIAADFGAMGKKVMDAVKAAPGKAKDLAVKGKDAVVMNHKQMTGNFRQGYEGVKSSIKGVSQYGDKLTDAERKARAVGGLKRLGEGALRASPYAAVAGAGGVGVAKAVGSKKEEQAQ